MFEFDLQQNYGTFWNKFLQTELNKDYMLSLRRFLEQQELLGKKIYPKRTDIFNAFSLTPYERVKVVILGQDPYHGENQAHGLSFSVKLGVKPPPSLVNIYKEIYSDLGKEAPVHGCLEKWAKQGVMLLNSVLTVEKSQAASHQGKGWERFTDEVIKAINAKESPVVFVLWGAYAQEKGKIIDENKHLIIKSPHPSPFSAHRGFLGSKPFSKVNEYLLATEQKEVDWELA